MYPNNRFVLIANILLILLGPTASIPAFSIATLSNEEALTFTDQFERHVRSKRLADPNRVQLHTKEVDLRQHRVELAQIDALKPVPLIVSIDTLPSSTWKDALASTGAQVVGPLPPSAFLVRANRASAAAIVKLAGVSSLAYFADDWKITARVPPGPVPAEVEIVLFAGAESEPVISKVMQTGQILWHAQVMNRQIIRALLNVAALDHIKALPEVEIIDAAGVGGMMNNEVRVILQTEKSHHTANQAFYNPIYNLGVWGGGQIITLADSGLEDHEVYANPTKILANYAVPNTCVISTGDAVNHGTGVAATLLGDKIGLSALFDTANDFDGLALRATMAMQDIVDSAGLFCPPTDYALDLFFPAWQVGSMVHSNSWGHFALINNPQGTYSWRSQLIDEYTSLPVFREQVIVYAAGNAGATFGHATLPDGTYMPYSLSDEAHAKNAIVVGGSGNGNARDFMYLFSSRGPTDDCLGTPCVGIQRVKPDLLAPADFFVDTADISGFSDYSIFPGTSVSAPAIAAAAALIRDYFAQGIYPVNANDPPLGDTPSAALVKAMLVNATVPIYDASGYQGNAAQGLPADAYPNYDQGYGRPVLDTVLEPAGYRKLKAYEDGTTTVVTGDVWQRTVNFKEKWGSACSTIRFTLAWHDPSAALAAGIKLVNDLDLEVDFQGTVYKGNHRLTGNTQFDTTNNVEDVFVPLRQQQVNTQLQAILRVYGSNIPSGPQPFAVVATYGACADRLPCPPPKLVGGCYRGPGDTVPGSNWTPNPGCEDQIYSSGEYDGSGVATPFCEIPSQFEEPIIGDPMPIDP